MPTVNSPLVATPWLTDREDPWFVYPDAITETSYQGQSAVTSRTSAVRPDWKAFGEMNTYSAARAAGAIHTEQRTTPVPGGTPPAGIQKFPASSETVTVEG